MDWAECAQCRVHSTAAHAIYNWNCQTPLTPHSFNLGKVHQSFMWSNHNYSIVYFKPVHLQWNLRLICHSLWLSWLCYLPIRPRCHVYYACNIAREGLPRDMQHKLLPKWPIRRAINVKSSCRTVVQDYRRLNRIGEVFFVEFIHDNYFFKSWSLKKQGRKH